MAPVSNSYLGISLCEKINARVGGGKIKLLMNAGGNLLLVYVPDILDLCPVSGVESGISIDLVGKQSVTVLYQAVLDRNVEAVKLFISLGANINAVNLRSTPLLAAIRLFDEGAMAKILINATDTISKTKGIHATPLFEACRYPNRKKTTIDLLLEKGADVNERDDYGRTAMHALVDDRSPDVNYISSIITDFLSRGADINVVASRVGDQATLFGTPLDISRDVQLDRFLIANGAKSASFVIDDLFKKLEEKVEQGSTGNTNPTDEWPRKMWEIDLGEPIGPLDHEIGNNNSIVFKTGRDSHWVTKEGESFRIENTIIGKEDIVHLDNNNLIYKTYGNREISVNMLSRSDELVALNQINIKNLEVPPFSHNSTNIGLSKDGTKVTAWDFTPPTLDSTDNEGGNNGGNKAMSRLSIGTSGPDISIATDGKLGGPAELQKSNDLKNWRKLSDVPANPADLLITPRDSGNEFFRLKRVGE